jgi:hypothetical protein
MCRIKDQDALARNRKWFEEHSYFIQALRARGLNPRPDRRLHQYVGTEDEAAYIETLLATLQRVPTLDARFRFTSALDNTTVQYDPTEVIKLYNQLDDAYRKGGLVGTLAQSNPIDIGSWFVHLLENETDYMARRAVAWAVGFSSAYPMCRDLLIKHYAEFPLDALKAFEQAGGEAELELLKTFDHENADVAEEGKAYYRKLLPKVINKLEKRVERQRKRDEKERLREEKRRQKKGSDQ